MMLSTIAIIFAVVFLVVGVTTVYKGKATQTFTFAVSILVAFVPEGLPSTVTLLCVNRVGSLLRRSTILGSLLLRSAWLPKMYWSKIYKGWRL
jgi:magnesium-transporting ATPase (P-type)